MKKFKLKSFALLFLSLILMVFTSCTDKIQNISSEGLRIVSLIPSNTEILVGLSLGENIVGLDEYSAEVSGVNKNAQVFKIGDPNIEELVKLDPDIILISGHSSDESKYTELKNAGVKIINIESPETIQGIYDSIILIGKEVGKEIEANKMVEDLKVKVEEIKSKVKREPIRFYFEISQAPYLYSFGKNTFLNEMVEICGGENIFNNLDGWIAPSEEAIINENPQIIFTNVYTENNIDEIKSRAGWENVDAVKNNNVYYIDKNFSSRPSQFFIKAIDQIYSAIQNASNENK